MGNCWDELFFGIVGNRMQREDGCSQRVRGRTWWDRAIECLSVVGARCLSVNSRYFAKKKKNKPGAEGEDVVRPARDSMGNPFHGGFGDIAFFCSRVHLGRRAAVRTGAVAGDVIGWTGGLRSRGVVGKAGLSLVLAGLRIPFRSKSERRDLALD